MKKKLVVTMVALFVLALSFALLPKKANAIPAFAQKYHFSCAVCHTVFPNLNPFGRAFWRNGFRLPGTNGTPADATQITEGLSLPNPWPIPVMVEPIISYQHTTNENVSNATDPFSAMVMIADGGSFPLANPLANSISFYVHYALNSMSNSMSNPISDIHIVASINGLGSGLGVAPHLFNLQLGNVMTASPYFYRSTAFYLTSSANESPVPSPIGNGQGLGVGYDGEATALIHHRNPGFALYGTPGYHLWYKVSVTNDAGSPNTSNGVNGATALENTGSNAMEYSYQLKEYAPIPMGQLELGYYGATVAEPIGGTAGWTNLVMVNGVDVDLANDVYELGLTYMVQSDSNPYANNGAALPAGVSQSNGYSTFEVYGRYILPVMNNGIMLSADYAQYSWTHKNTQLEFLNGGNGTADNAGLYGGPSLPGTVYNGIQDALALQAEINLALNAHLYLGYTITNQNEDNLLGTGLDFAF